MHSEMRCTTDLPENLGAGMRLSDIAKLACAANLYVCTALIRFEGGAINCKSIIELTALAQRSLPHMTLETIGPNAKECFDVLLKLVETLA
jgi:phosphotransferase system HPr-like phosphotransfer protein